MIVLPWTKSDRPLFYNCDLAKRESVTNLAFNVHTHPTLSEVLDEAYKRAAV